MATIKPFRALRPHNEYAAQVASRPYDVLNSEEARKEVQGNLLSFLHVTKAEIDLPADVDIHSDAVYQKAAENLSHFMDRKILFQDENPCYYIYELAWKGRTQTGLVCVSSVEDYFNDVIKKHEFTRPEKEKDRIDHMRQLRELQDRTGGFNTFIPLKFRNGDNDMSNVPEASLVEDLKLYSIARLYMDNFPHLKAYWPMLGRKNAQLTLSFGVDDIDGTIDDSTKIYSMAGSEEQTPAMTTEEIVALIRQVNRQPVERDTLYNTLQEY